MGAQYRFPAPSPQGREARRPVGPRTDGSSGFPARTAEPASRRFRTMTRFEGRTALVTGAGSGLGRATALALAAEGARVACLDIAADAAEKTAADADGQAVAIGVDVSDPASVKAGVAAAAEQLGRPSLLINCAGIGRFEHTHLVPFEDWQRILGVNLTGTFLMCQAAIPHFLDGGGVIVNIASNAGIKAQPYSAAYCASKAGVVHLTKCLADEYLKRGIRANCIAPGGIETPLQQEFMKMPEGVDWKAFRKVMTPLGNSTPEEIAGVALFVASDAARYMTGAVVSVDGGITV